MNRAVEPRPNQRVNPRSGVTPPTRPGPRGQQARYVYLRRPRCPSCGGKALRAYKTLPASGDGSVSRYVRCRDCGHRCILIEE